MNRLVRISIILIIIFSNLLPVYAEEKKQLIVINKTTNMLSFIENGNLVKNFPVATGRDVSLTPEGVFKIVNKIKNRPYYTGGIPGGSPKNPLGDRWLGLNARGTWGTTYGIHGNNNPKSIGTYASSGCVRMFNEDVRWLFDRVAINATVFITRSTKNLPEIVNSIGYSLDYKYFMGKTDLTVYDSTKAPLKPMAVLNKEQIFEKLAVAGDWVQIQLGNQKGYVLKSALVPVYDKKLEEFEINPDQLEYRVAALTELKVYQDPRTSSSSMARILKGQKIEVLDQVGDFYQVKSAGRVGYVLKSNTKIEEQTFKVSVDAPIYKKRAASFVRVGTAIKDQRFTYFATTKDYVVLKVGANLNYIEKEKVVLTPKFRTEEWMLGWLKPITQLSLVRDVRVYASKDNNSKTIAAIWKGAVLEVSDADDGWYLLELGGKAGYIIKP